MLVIKLGLMEGINVTPRLYWRSPSTKHNPLFPVRSLNSSAEAMKRLETYTTFVVTRQPLDRVVSAHNSKFTGRYTDLTYRQRIGRKIALGQANAYMHGIHVNAQT